MAGKALTIKVCDLLKLHSGLTGNYLFILPQKDTIIPFQKYTILI